MSYTIVLDAGHGGSDSGAVYNGRQEKDDNLKLTMKVGNYLTEAGYDVVYTRTTDVYNTPFEKAQIGNENEADLFVSLHRNSSPNENTYNGIQTLVYNDEGFKSELARNINKNLVQLGFEDKGVVERPNLVVLKRTKMPAALVEVGFINSDKDNKIFDEQLDQVAQAIALGIENTVNQDKEQHDGRYTVQTGAFRNQYLAYDMAQTLSEQGIPANVVYEDGLYKVRSGYFTDLDNAAMLEKKIKSEGYNAFVVYLAE